MSNRSWLIRGGLTLLVVLVRLPSLYEPAWYSDDGFFMSVAWLTSKGLPLYGGVYDNSPPGIYWLYRAMLAIGAREHHVVVQAAAALAVLSSVLLTFEIARRLCAGSVWPASLAAGLTAVGLSLPTLDGDLLNVEIAALPFFLAALAIAFNRSISAAALSGAVLGCALAIRPSYAFDALALLVLLPSAAAPLKRLAMAAAGLASVGGAVVAALSLQRSLSPYVNLVLPSDHSYLLWANGNSLAPLYARLGFLALVAAGGFAMSRSLRGRLLAVWIPAAIAGASLTPREFTHYVHEAIPALSVGIAMLAGGVRILWRPAAAAAGVAALVVAAEAVLILPAQEVARLRGVQAPQPFLHNFAFTRLPAYYENWFAFISGAKSESQYRAWFPGDVRRDVSEGRQLYEAAGRQPVRILVLGDQPWLFVAGGLEPATPFLATNSSFWRVSSAPLDVSRTIAGGCADFVIDIDVGGGWARELRSDSYAPVPHTPWPTFTPKARSPSCAIPSQ